MSYIPSARILKLCMIQTDIYYMIYRDKNYQKIKTLIKYDPELVFILVHVNKDILINYIKKLSHEYSDFYDFLSDFAGSAMHHLYIHQEQIIYLMANRNLLKTLVTEFDSYDKYLNEVTDGYINVVFYLPIKIENDMIKFQINIQTEDNDKFFSLVNSLLIYNPKKPIIEISESINDKNTDITYKFIARKDSILELKFQKRIGKKPFIVTRTFNTMHVPILSQPNYIIKWGVYPD